MVYKRSRSIRLLVISAGILLLLIVQPGCTGEFNYQVRLKNEDNNENITFESVVIEVGGRRFDTTTDGEGLARISIPNEYEGKSGKIIIDVDGYEYKETSIDVNDTGVSKTVLLKPDPGREASGVPTPTNTPAGTGGFGGVTSVPMATPTDSPTPPPTPTDTPKPTDTPEPGITPPAATATKRPVPATATRRPVVVPPTTPPPPPPSTSTPTNTPKPEPPAGPTMPNVVGMERTAAGNTLRGQGIAYNEVHQGGQCKIHTVLSSVPAAGQPAGDRATLFVCSLMPNVVGTMKSEAIGILTSRGIPYTINETRDGSKPRELVWATTPSPKQPIALGQKVVLNVIIHGGDGNGDDDCTRPDC